jgi:hypothetical protein
MGKNLNFMIGGVDLFYSRINEVERKHVKWLVEHVSDYFARLGRPNLGVAGVGSVLRDLVSAKDIDIAVVGFSYCAPDTHSFRHVELFTEEVANYFRNLASSLITPRYLGGGEITIPSKAGPFSSGSGPFCGLNEGLEGVLEGGAVRMTSNVENFGLWNSKGLQVNFQGCRPIDLQFVFNRTLAEWEADMRRSKLPYLVLHGDKTAAN